MRIKEKLFNRRTVRIWLHGLLLLSILAIAIIKFTPYGQYLKNQKNFYTDSTIDLLFNISLCYIASAIFYFVVVYLPNEINRQTTMRILEQPLLTIGLQLNASVNYIYLRMNSEGKSIESESDFLGWDKFTDRKLCLKTETKIKATGNHGGPTVTYKSEIDHFVKEKQIVENTINHIFAIPAIIHVEPELIELLATIKRSRVYWGAEGFQKNRDVIVINFSKGLYEYVKTAEKLFKYIEFPYELSYEFVEEDKEILAWIEEKAVEHSI